MVSERQGWKHASLHQWVGGAVLWRTTEVPHCRRKCPFMFNAWVCDHAFGNALWGLYQSKRPVQTLTLSEHAAGNSATLSVRSRGEWVEQPVRSSSTFTGVVLKLYDTVSQGWREYKHGAAALQMNTLLHLLGRNKINKKLLFKLDWFQGLLHILSLYWFLFCF